MNINRGKALKKAHYSGFLTRLAKNQAGNVMPLLGFLVFPMAAMVGGAVDLSRIYTVQTRLQNACDAPANSAVLYVELQYDYQPVVPDFLFAPRTITYRSAYSKREGIATYPTNLASLVAPQRRLCSVRSAT